MDVRDVSSHHGVVPAQVVRPVACVQERLIERVIGDVCLSTYVVTVGEVAYHLDSVEDRNDLHS